MSPTSVVDGAANAVCIYNFQLSEGLDMKKVNRRDAIKSVAAGAGAVIAASVSPPDALARPGRPGWYVRVCKKNTKADEIKFQVGANEKTRKAWFTWKRAGSPDVAEFDFPADLLNAGHIYLRADGIPNRKECRVCICFRDHVVRHMDFDNGEDHEQNWNDTDRCEC